MLKILIVHPQMALYGGAELVIVELARYLMSRGHKVTILTLNIDNHKEYEGLDFILPPEGSRIGYRLRGGLASIYNILQIYFRLRELCLEYMDDYDIVNAHNFPAIWSIPNNKKAVFICNELPDLWHNARANGIVNKMFGVARKLDSKIVRAKKPISIVADKRCAIAFARRYNYHPEIVHYGINGSFFADSKHKPPPDKFRIISPAMISPSKNQLGILQSVVTLTPYIPNMEVILSGYREPNHPYSILLDKYIKAHNLNVTYLAPTSREKLREVYSSCSVAVFAGKGQGSWLSPFELLSAGVPVVVTPNLTCSGLIQSNNIGTVTDDLFSALIKIRCNYRYFTRQAMVGQKFVLNELAWDSFGRKVEYIMEESLRID